MSKRALVALLLAVVPLLATGEVWLKVVAPQFTLYSSAKSSEALRAAVEFQQFIGALGEVKRVDTKMLSPLTIVMLAKEKDFWPFRPLRPDGKPRDVAGFFSRQEGWAVFGLAGTELDENVRRTVFHEGVHWFLSGSEFQNPPWLEEGLAEVFSTFVVDQNRRKWGKPIFEHVQIFQLMHPMPLKDLLGISHSDQLFNETRRTGLFYAESWAFVHFLLFGERNRGRTLLEDYVKAYQSGINPDDAFKSVFKLDYRGMDRELARYLNGGRYFVGSYPLSPSAVELKTEPASDLEREIALVRLALGSKQLDVAQAHINKARSYGTESAAVSEVAGYAAAMRGDDAVMLREFTEAARLGSTDYWVYFDSAQRRHQAGNQSGGAVDLSANEARQIAKGYEKTIDLRPGFLPAYQGLGGVIGLLGKENKSDRDFLKRGRDLFPVDGMIQLGLAISAREAGENDEALSELADVLAAPEKFPSNVISYAERINANWVYETANAKIRTLVEAEHYEDALVALDVLLAKGVPQSDRTVLAMNRVNLVANIQLLEVQKACDEQRWTDARKLLETMLSSSSQTDLTREARRRLAELDRRNLGRNESGVK